MPIARGESYTNGAQETRPKPPSRRDRVGEPSFTGACCCVLDLVGEGCREEEISWHLFGMNINHVNET